MGRHGGDLPGTRGHRGRGRRVLQAAECREPAAAPGAARRGRDLAALPPGLLRLSPGAPGGGRHPARLETLAWALVGCRILLPLGFLVALFQAELFAAHALRQFMERLVRRPTPEQWRDSVATALDDPRLAIGYWDPASGRYREADGVALAEPAAGSGQVGCRPPRCAPGRGHGHRRGARRGPGARPRRRVGHGAGRRERRARGRGAGGPRAHRRGRRDRAAAHPA